MIEPSAFERIKVDWTPVLDAKRERVSRVEAGYMFPHKHWSPVSSLSPDSTYHSLYHHVDETSRVDDMENERNDRTQQELKTFQQAIIIKVNNGQTNDKIANCEHIYLPQNSLAARVVR